MKVSNISSQNFGLGLKPSMKSELKYMYKTLQKHQEGLQPEFLDNVMAFFIDKCANGFLDFRVVKSWLGLKTVKQCFLSTPQTEFLIWNKKTGLFSSDKTHLTADDLSEIVNKIYEVNVVI